MHTTRNSKHKWKLSRTQSGLSLRGAITGNPRGPKPVWICRETDTRARLGGAIYEASDKYKDKQGVLCRKGAAREGDCAARRSPHGEGGEGRRVKAGSNYFSWCAIRWVCVCVSCVCVRLVWREVNLY